jgi:hypothetical protein
MHIREQIRKAVDFIEGINETPRTRKARLAFRAFAPFYFILFILGRVFTETQVLAVYPTFSYYTALHHLSWFSIVTMLFILEFHIILRLPVKKLLWLLYGASITATPLVYSWLSGNLLQMSYIDTDAQKIALDILGFSFLNPKNRPLAPEMVLVFLALVVCGKYYTGKWRWGWLLAILSYLVNSMTAVTWFGWRLSEKVLFPLQTSLANDAFFAVLYMHVILALLLLLVWRGGLFEGEGKYWAAAFLGGAASWLVWLYVLRKTHWFPTSFDITAAALPAFVIMSMVSRFMLPNLTWKTLLAFGIFSVYVAYQAVILIPVYGKFDKLLGVLPGYKWTIHTSSNTYTLPGGASFNYLEENHIFGFERDFIWRNLRGPAPWAGPQNVTVGRLPGQAGARLKGARAENMLERPWGEEPGSLDQDKEWPKDILSL